LYQLRIKTIETGSGIGFIGGRLVKEVCTLEGQENAPPPHKYGSTAKHFGFGFNSAVTASGLWYPDHDKRFIVTDVQMSVDGNNAVVTIYESGNGNLNDPNRWVSAVRGAAQALSTSINFRTPFVASSTGSPLMINCSSTAYVYGVVCGYEAD